MRNPYTAINASAGSGKTYTLVQRVLMICLENPYQHDAIKNILALTFTNKAANEMKERILHTLKKFSGENYASEGDLISLQKAFENAGVKISLEELHRRAKKVLDFILHNYSTLNIGTIDKFNSRLVRSFSYELGLSQNFNLEIQPEPYLIEAVDQMLDKIGEDEKISGAFMDFMTYNLDNNERVNLNSILYSSAKNFISDIHYNQLQKNQNFDWRAYEETKDRLRQELKDLKKDILQIAQNVIDLLEEKELEIADFSGGNNNGIAKFFYSVKKFFNGEAEKFPFPGNEVTAQATFAKGCSPKSKKREAEILEILDFLLEERKRIIKNYISTKKKEKILKALLPLKVNKEIQDQLALIEDEKDLVLLSKFNILINENLRNEPSAFIYEKVGARYQHYFFDEFQDTSAMQWQNIIPLRDHTTSSENHSFTLVGDPKQSIYRFRGGDSQLMIDILNQKEEANVKAIEETKQENWRSGRNIVAFNNMLYNYLSQFTNEMHMKVFGEKAQQQAQKNFDGRVRVNFLEKSVKDVYYQQAAEKMQQDIQQCLDNGYTFFDITLLCRGNKEILKFSQLLGQLKVTISGEEIFIKTISEKGLTLNLSPTLNALISFLRWESSPKNLQHLVMMLYYLEKSGKISVKDFTAETLHILGLKDRDAMLKYIAEKFLVQLQQENFPHLNLYNYIEYYVHEFSVEGRETDFLLNFLEMLYGYTQNSGATLKDFLNFWNEEGQETSIQSSENIDAIQIMTIHKAKGLEFPVVLLPLENNHKDSKINEWLELSDENTLSSVHIDGFPADLAVYDEEIEKFNSETSYKNLIDRFCVQYVATTRAVEQLFLYVVKPGIDKKGSENASKLELYDFLQQHNKENAESFDFFEVDELSLKKQQYAPKPILETQNIECITQKHEKSSSIKIATPSKNYQNRVESVRTGIFTHEILEKINSRKDVEDVLEGYLLAGEITNEERDEIRDRIVKVTCDSKYASYFAEDVKVITEREIMISENGSTTLLRPDRLVETDKGFVIIDFKTGAEKEKYEIQLERYRYALEKTGRKVIGTEIIYV